MNPSKYHGQLAFRTTTVLLTMVITIAVFAQQPGVLDPTLPSHKSTGSVLTPATAMQPISLRSNSDKSTKRGVIRNSYPIGFQMVPRNKEEPRVVENRGSSTVEGPNDASLFSGVGPDGTDVNAIAILGNDVFVGGSFTTAGGISAKYIAKWDGSNWSPLGLGMNGHVNALAISANGDLYAGGSFTIAGGVSANRIAKWNGLTWSPVGAGFNAPVYSLATSGTTIYAGGDFSIAGSTPGTSIARWNGSSWSVPGYGVTNRVTAIALSGGNVYTGGRFVVAGGDDEAVMAFRIARWNGSSWAAFGSGINSFGGEWEVRGLLLAGGILYAGGNFTTAGGQPANNIAFWNGFAWSTFSSGMNGIVYALSLSGNGDVYAGGGFTNAAGTSANRIAKWDGTSWSPVGSGMNGTVHALAISANGTVYAGGHFTTAGGKPAGNIARWNGSDWSDLVRTTAPSQAADITFSGVRPYHMDVGWTNGNGHGRVVKINTVNSFTAPADGVNPSSDSRYGGSGEQVVYNGNGSTLTVTGLSPNTAYYFRVYEYNNYGPYTLFNRDTVTNNPNSQTTVSCKATITVLNTNDSGAGSLRHAIDEDICPGGTINFDSSVFATPQTITLTSGQLMIERDLTIRGPGASLLSISGNNASRLFYVAASDRGVSATLDGMTIRNGDARDGYYGGGILNDGTLTVINSAVSSNGAFNGGGISNSGTLSIVNSNISANGGLNGGGIYNYSSGALSVINSTVSGNAATFVFDPENGSYGGDGGGIYNEGTLAAINSTISSNSAYYGGGAFSHGMMTVANSTISENIAGVHGGGMFDVGTLIVTNATIFGNTAATGGGIHTTTANATLRNAIVAGNIATNDLFSKPDIDGTISTASHSLIGDASSSGGITNGVNGNIVGGNPLLGPLQNNGGSTLTHALLTGSPAFNAGDNCVLTANGCGDGNPALPSDQRGFGRVENVDIGAFELQTQSVYSLSGRVVSPSGLGLRNAVVTLTDPLGNRRTVLTSSLGYYSFDNVAAGEMHTVAVQSKRFRFEPRSMLMNDNLRSVDFYGME